MRIFTGLFVVVFWGCWVTCPVEGQEAEFFEEQVAPLLIRRCVECHQGSTASGGLDLTSSAGLRRGGDSGEVLDGHIPLDGLLWQRVDDGDMPPEQQGHSQELPDSEKAVLRQWTESGSGWPDTRVLDYFERTNDLRAGRDWWSLQPVKMPDLPVVQNDSGNPIDAFIEARLLQAGLTMAPEADRRTLVRRLYYDLWGLPPTLDEIETFLQDRDPEAWPRLVDRLLESPKYGERWGRYWLDVARYADTSGYERDQEKPFAWRYRDWVIRALNDDMPYDQFVLQQIAGDQIPEATEASVIATGFLRLGSWNDEPNDPEDYRYDRLEDLVHTTSSAFLGLTVKCARCHNHKFDPITQEDYYRFAAAFWRGPLEVDRERELLGGPTEEELGFARVLGWTDVQAEVEPLHVLKNGERGHPLQPVTPEPISAITGLVREKTATGSHDYDNSRLELARWLIHPEQPLLDRVVVNRIWQHHFGKALVRTPNNFGFLADPPTHPELLDWLAAEFQNQGRSFKSVHRMILNSRVWRQSSNHPEAEAYESRDSANRYWWHAERRRLDAEALRDSLLAVSQELELSVGGPGFRPEISPEALEGLSMKGGAWQASPAELQKRRSIYVFLKRGLMPPMMSTFDLCDPTFSCGQRDSTTVPTQALALMNNRFVHERSLHLAERIQAENRTAEQRIERAWRSVLQRRPSAAEEQLALRHLATQRPLIEKQQQTLQTQGPVHEIPANLLLHIRADRVETRQNADGQLIVSALTDLADQGHRCQVVAEEAAPRLEKDGWGGQPILALEGRHWLSVAGAVLKDSTCTIVCVASDDGNGNRELISNWNGEAGNSGQSIFLGLADDHRVRFSDAMSQQIEDFEPGKPFLLTASNGNETAAIYWNGRKVGQGPSLPERRLDTDWVIGTQGNIQGEYWHGGLAEIRVYDRPLTAETLKDLHQELAQRYQIPLQQETTREAIDDPETLALASLIHVLLNSNEFLYVD